MKDYDGWIIKSKFHVPNFLVAHTFRITRAVCISSYCRALGREWYDKNRKKGNLKCVKVQVLEVF